MPRQSEAMEVGDISQDLDQAEENDLVEDVYIYLTKGQYPVWNGELFYIKKKSRKVNFGQKLSAFIYYSAPYIHH